jgi:hypothetical protein
MRGAGCGFDRDGPRLEPGGRIGASNRRRSASGDPAGAHLHPGLPGRLQGRTSPEEAAADILSLASLAGNDERGVRLCRSSHGNHELELKTYRRGGLIPLSEAVPVLENFGFRVLEEIPTSLAGGTIGYIHDFRLELPGVDDVAPILERAETIEQAISSVLSGRVRGRRVQPAGAVRRMRSDRGRLDPLLVPLPAPDRKRVRAAHHRRGPSPGARGEPGAGRPVPRCPRPPGPQIAKRRSIAPSRSSTRRWRAFARSTTTGSSADARACGSDRSNQRLLAGRRRGHCLQDRFKPGAGPARADPVAGDLGLFASGRGNPPARRPGRSRRPSLVGSPRRFPHRNPGPDEGAAGQELGDRPDRRQGRLLSKDASSARRS